MTRNAWLRSWTLLATLAAHALGAPASAQCTTQWQRLNASPIAARTVETVGAWDPDGPGPAPARVVAGGSIPTVDGVAAGGIAVCDLTTGQWSTLAGGTDGTVDSLVAMPNGDLVVAGPFRTAGGVAAHGIARWNGSAWAPLGGGLTVGSGALQVRALVVLSHGDLVAAGNFTAAGGAAAGGLARWNGTAWTAIPAVLSGGNRQITALAALPNGELAVGGDFTAIGGVAAASVARWNGTAWSPLGAGFQGGVRSLAVTGSSHLVAAASLYTGGQVVSLWDGSTWRPLATLVGTIVQQLVAVPGGVAAAGTFQAIGGVAAAGVAAWDGTAWRAFGAGLPGVGGANPLVGALAVLPSGHLAAATSEGPHHWDGVTWRPLVQGPQYVTRMMAESDGGLLAAGGFLTASGFTPLSQWDGATWLPIATPLAAITALARRPNGNLVVGGARLAEWDGNRWTLAADLGGQIMAMLALPNGDVVVGGSWVSIHGQSIARWNGSSWSALGAGLGLWDAVRALTSLPNGDVIAGGDFVVAGNGMVVNRIARWNGVAWSSVGGGVNGPVRSLAAAPNGDVYAAGDFTMAGGIAASHVAHWNGTAWAAMPGLPPMRVFALALLPDGDLVAAGHDLRPMSARQPVLARWNGASWTGIGAGLVAHSYGGVHDLAFGRDGLYVGGSFTSAGGTPASCVARLASTCPATTLAWGSGCGGRTLTASAPWLGSTLRTTGSAPTGPALTVLVHGFAPTSLPLARVLPTALPGCTLMVQPDHVAIVAVTGGRATATLVLPNTPALAGTVLRQQLVALELAGSLAATASNALLLTFGAY